MQRTVDFRTKRRRPRDDDWLQTQNGMSASSVMAADDVCNVRRQGRCLHGPVTDQVIKTHKLATVDFIFKLKIWRIKLKKTNKP